MFVDKKTDLLLEKNCDNIDKLIIQNLIEKFKQYFPAYSINLSTINNFEYEAPYDEEKLVRNLQTNIYQNFQIEFLKNYDIFNLQHDILKKYLSVKYKFLNAGMKGKSIKVALLDSGINNNLINCNLINDINFTNEENKDYTGHGTYLASVIIFIKFRFYAVKN